MNVNTIRKDTAGQDVTMALMLMVHRSKPYLVCLMKNGRQGLELKAVQELLESLSFMTMEDLDLFFSHHGTAIDVPDDLRPDAVRAHVNQILEDMESDPGEEMPVLLN